MPLVVSRAESIQYDGTNGEEVAAWIGADAMTEADGHLTLTITVWGEPNDYRLQVGWWLIQQGGQCAGAQSPADYARVWYELPTT